MESLKGHGDWENEIVFQSVEKLFSSLLQANAKERTSYEVGEQHICQCFFPSKLKVFQGNTILL